MSVPAAWSSTSLTHRLSPGPCPPSRRRLRGHSDVSGHSALLVPLAITDATDRPRPTVSLEDAGGSAVAAGLASNPTTR
jgi:hypothetical protein